MKAQSIIRLLWHNIFPVKKIDYLTYFVTNRCNCTCKHCFVNKGNTGIGSELNIDEIKMISEKMGKIIFLNLTGGEPYIRNDLPDIAKIFYKNNGVELITTPTNGYYTEKIVSDADKILYEQKDKQFCIDISIDDIGNNHDRIRGQKGLFNRAVETYNQLKKIKHKYNNFNLGVNITYSALNQNNIKQIYRYVKDELKPDTITVLLIRGNPYCLSSKNIDINKYENIGKQNIGKWGGNNNYFSNLNGPFIKLRKELIVKTVKTNIRQIKCYAGINNIVISCNGDIYPCEMLNKKLGNIKERSYDLNKILHSDNVKRIREHINRTKCYCTHECNMTSNIICSPTMLIKLINKYFIDFFKRYEKKNITN